MTHMPSIMPGLCKSAGPTDRLRVMRHQHVDNMQVTLLVPEEPLRSATAILTLDLYEWQTQSGAPQAKSGLQSAVAKLGQRKANSTADSSSTKAGLQDQVAKLSSAAGIPAVKVPGAKTGKGSRASSDSSAADSPGSSPSNSVSSSRSSSQGSKREAAEPIKPASADSRQESKTEADMQAALRPASAQQVLVCVGRVIFPLRQLPPDRSGEIVELEGEFVPQDPEQNSAVEQGVQVAVEVQMWSAAAYAEQHSSSPAQIGSAGNAQSHN